MNATVKQEALRPGQPDDYQDVSEILNRYHYQYNHQILHAGIAFLRPADVFFGRAELVLDECEVTINATSTLGKEIDKIQIPAQPLSHSSA